MSHDPVECPRCHEHYDPNSGHDHECDDLVDIEQLKSNVTELLARLADLVSALRLHRCCPVITNSDTGALDRLAEFAEEHKP